MGHRLSLSVHRVHLEGYSSELSISSQIELCHHTIAIARRSPLARC